jgi:hypothetical protein
MVHCRMPFIKARNYSSKDVVTIRHPEEDITAKVPAKTITIPPGEMNLEIIGDEGQADIQR